MTRFRLKNVDFEAEPYRDGMEDEWALLQPLGALMGRYDSRRAAEGCLSRKGEAHGVTSVPVVRTAAGRVPVWPGDWIIRNGGGQRRVLTPDDIFDADYDFAEGRGHDIEAIGHIQLVA